MSKTEPAPQSERERHLNKWGCPAIGCTRSVPLKRERPHFVEEIRKGRAVKAEI